MSAKISTLLNFNNNFASKLQENIVTVANQSAKREREKVNQLIYTKEEKLLTSSLDKLSSLGSSTIKKHSNLYHFLKKDLHSAEEIREFVSKLSEDEKYVGCLPNNWRTKFKKEDVSDKTKKVQKILSSFATEAYSIKEYPVSDLRMQIAILADKLSEIFHETPKISFVGSGEYGKVFRIQCANEDLALKIYHSDSFAYNSFNHGNLKEIGNAIAVSNTLKPSQTSKFYCAKLSDDTEQGAFMLTSFIEDNKMIVNKKIKLKRFNLCDTEKNGNIINNKIVDYGAISH